LNTVTQVDWPFLDYLDMRELIISTKSELISHSDGKYHYITNNKRNLHTHVQEKKRLEEDEVRGLYQQIVRIVAFCHSLGIIVRDLRLRKFDFYDEEL
jgi:serine/threonine protein kinase